MPPRSLLLRPHAVRILQLRPRVPPPAACLLAFRQVRAFAYARDSIPPPPPPKGPSQDPLPHVSEEAAAASKITGETSPELEQGTPVAEVIARDPDAQKNAPGVLKPDIAAAAGKGGKRSYSTMAEAAGPPPNVDYEAMLAMEQIPPGAKFPLPELPLPENSRLQHRYSPIVEQVTNIIMLHGKKTQAQRVLNQVLLILRTRPPPESNLRTPIIPSAPPLLSLPRDPVAYLQTAIDSVAPLLRIKSVKGSGGFREQMPVPLGLRQRRRKAITWLLEAAEKKKGRLGLAERIADEVIAIIEGRSSAWEKRGAVHKTATQNRANVKVRATV